MRNVFFLVCGLLWLMAPLELAAKNKEKVDRIALAALLIKDGHLDRADAVLAEVDTKQKGLDLGRYYTLRGVIGLRTKSYVKASLFLQKALLQKGVDPMVGLFLAQARFRLSRYAEALQALKEVPAQALELPGTLLLRAQCLWRLGKKQEAYRWVALGAKRFPTNEGFVRLQVMWLLKLDIFEQGQRLGWRYLQDPKRKVEDYLALGEMMRRRRQPLRAALWLEQARLRFPAEQRVLLMLARCYLEGRKTYAAAVLLEQASRHERKLIVEAAELYRRAGQRWKALYLNAQVLDQKAKIKQRLGLLIEMERFEEAAAMGPRLSRLELLEDQRIMYALGFAAFEVGRYQKARVWLSKITDRTLFQKSIALRKAMQTCLAQQDAWWCP
ncbi:MAG: hypothetical protein H6728_13260 [Myxococcales bacterium]|nr:hypothetical protein [Myxococcales bacterium]